MSDKTDRGGSRTLEDRVRALHDVSGSLRSRLKAGAAPAEISMAVRALLRELDEVTSMSAPLRDLLETAERAAESELLRIGAELRDACVDKGWTVDGSWPQFFVERSVGVYLDEKARVAIVAGRRVPAVADKVVRALSPIVKQLFPKSYTPAGFLEDLAGAADVVARPGSQAPILQVYRQLIIDSQPARLWKDARAEVFVPMSIEQFRARFSRAIEGSNQLADGRSLRLVPPLDAGDGIFVWQPAENRFGHVGRIQFRQDLPQQ